MFWFCFTPCSGRSRNFERVPALIKKNASPKVAFRFLSYFSHKETPLARSRTHKTTHCPYGWGWFSFIMKLIILNLKSTLFWRGFSWNYCNPLCLQPVRLVITIYTYLKRYCWCYKHTGDEQSNTNVEPEGAKYIFRTEWAFYSRFLCNYKTDDQK